MRRVIPFFAPEETPDEGRLAQIVKQRNPRRRHQARRRGVDPNAGVKAFRKVEAFRFYDAGLFRELESIAQEKRDYESGRTAPFEWPLQTAADESQFQALDQQAPRHHSCEGGALNRR
ncbi:hypothetical protein [Mesorhizobium sp. NZP2077]|uniref:hypothetical protein n=1 Tax=Mesorhizobium sp. NZP2077 TaxID=2483404 RepID=UPI0015552F37|nr:hypothetical protein [Mesorhizobium sp. NZP2077]QKD19787.1 hypothetical protein HGP13_35495 [Mesorhizobium sp. NZP2077]